MSWKEKPYWLKGGIIAIFISLIGLFIPYIKILFSFPVEFLNFIFPGLVNTPNPGRDIIIGLTIHFTIWFLIGAIIGWIYGKIKSRNNSQ